MPFAATRMDLEIITQMNKSNRERQISYDITHLESKKNTNEFIYKTETALQTQKINLQLLKGKEKWGRGKLGVWD